MADKPTRLEQQAITAWRIWGSEWAMTTACSSCGQVKPCRGKRRSRMLCLECWDEGKR